MSNDTDLNCNNELLENYTLTLNDSKIAMLYGDLKRIDNHIVGLQKAAMFNKTEHLEALLKENRLLLTHMVLALHAFKNDLQKLQGEKVQPCTLP